MVKPADYEGKDIERGQYMTRWWDAKKPRVKTDWAETVDGCFIMPIVPSIEDFPGLKELICQGKR